MSIRGGDCTADTNKRVDPHSRSAISSGDIIIPIYREFSADALTPTEAFTRLCRFDEPGFLLESMSGIGGGARFSYVGHRPRPISIGDGDPLASLHSLVHSRVEPVKDLPPFVGGAVGYVSYEVARHFEKLPISKGGSPRLPESSFLYVDDLAVFDHASSRLLLITLHRPEVEKREAALDRIERMRQRLFEPITTFDGDGPMPAARTSISTGRRGSSWTANISRAKFFAMAEQAREYILGGEIFQVVLSQRFSKPLLTSPSEIYRQLRIVNPSPYMFHLALGQGRHIIGASPELLVKVDGGQVETRPLAGTRWRGGDESSDATLETELRADEKERAEHIMLVDLGRNDIGRVALPGSVRTPRLMDVERYSHVMHLSSTVTGTLDADRDCLDALRSTFPAGTVTGAPKIRAMEIIAELEPEQRGVYGGAVGMIGVGGDLDVAITLRTLVIADGVIHVQAGAGIVADSDMEAEYQETINKAKAIFAAVERAEERL